MSLPFPNVPFAPGVPQLPRSSSVAVSEVVALATPLLSGLFGNTSPTWAIFDSSGKSAVQADSFLDFGNQNDSNIPTFPVEQGSFASYNKVILPNSITLRLTKGGSQADRTAFLMAIDAMYRSVNLYSIQTPETFYANMNLERYEVQRRGGQGAYWLSEVDLFFIQIIQVTQQYTNSSTTTQNAQNPSAQGTTNTGTVNAATPSAQASSDVTTGLANTAGY